MKKLPAQFITTSLATTLLLVSLSSAAFAQTTNTTIPVVTTTTSAANPPGRTTQATSPAMIKDKVTTQLPARKQAFLEKIAAFKDLKKKALVEKIDTKAGEINNNRTAQMSQALVKMNAILNDLTNKSTLAKEQGQDTTKLNTAITTAQAAIKTAEAAVATQVAKEYIPSITTETTLKTTVGATIRALQTDLRNTHAAVASAKQKVILAVVELKKLSSESTDKEATNSAANTSN